MPSRDKFISGPTRAEIRAKEKKEAALKKAIADAESAATAKRVKALQKKADSMQERVSLRSSATPQTYSYGGCGGGGGCGRG